MRIAFMRISPAWVGDQFGEKYTDLILLDAWAEQTPLLGKGGVDAPSRNIPVPLKGADGVVRSNSKTISFERTTPSAPVKVASQHFLDGRSHPLLRLQCAARRSICYRRHRECPFRLQGDNGNQERREADPIQPEKNPRGNCNGRDGAEKHDNWQEPGRKEVLAGTNRLTDNQESGRKNHSLQQYFLIRDRKP